jgi:hypothetical protein
MSSRARSWARLARVRTPRSVRCRATWGLGMGGLDLRGGLSNLRVVSVLVWERAGWGIRSEIWEPIQEGGIGG